MTPNERTGIDKGLSKDKPRVLLFLEDILVALATLLVVIAVVVVEVNVVLVDEAMVVDFIIVVAVGSVCAKYNTVALVHI